MRAITLFRWKFEGPWVLTSPLKPPIRSLVHVGVQTPLLTDNGNFCPRIDHCNRLDIGRGVEMHG